MKTSPAIWLSGAVALSIGLVLLLVSAESPETDDPDPETPPPTLCQSHCSGVL
jgi:hypothetical protein